MKIGILQTDSVLNELIGQFGNYPDMFQTLFLRADNALQFDVFNVVVGVYPTHWDDCDAYVITGSKSSVYDHDAWIRELGHYVESLNAHAKKIVAVCFGHQLVAEVFGGKTEKSSKGWGVGVQSVDVYQQKPWMQPPLTSFNVVVSHQDQVTRLPESSELLAGNAFCEHGMFQFGEHILTIQGHPEFSKDYASTMMQYRAAKLGEEKLSAGLRSLQRPVDDVQIAHWLLLFMQGSNAVI